MTDLNKPDWDSPGMSKALRESVECGPDDLVALPWGTDIPGAQHDDWVSAAAAIDVLRAYVDDYEQRQNDSEERR